MTHLRILLWIAGLFICSCVTAQHRGQLVSLAITNHHSAYPFSSFANLFSKEFHPGVELGYGFNWKTGPKHDWYQAFKAGYFYHRFVQYAIPVYTQLSYRYKPVQCLQLSAAIGAGYLHSIPATAVYELHSDGTYKNAKGIGRGQALVSFAVGMQYRINKNKQTAPTFFLDYQQQVQTPFIKSYVPLLPYNSIAAGVTLPLKTKNKF